MRNSRLLVLGAFVVALIVASPVGRSATPGSGSIAQPNNLTPGLKGGTTWVGPPGIGVANGGLSGDVVSAQCLGNVVQPQCDVYKLTFTAAADFWTKTAVGLTGFVDVNLKNFDTNDIDLYIFDANKVLVAESGNAAGVPERAAIVKPTPNSVYYVVAYYYDGNITKYDGSADLYIANDAAPNTMNAQLLQFSATTWADLQRTGGEPMLNVDRSGAHRNVYVDWPFSSTLSTSIVSRSTDGGDSYRPLFDPACLTGNGVNRNNSTLHCTGAGGGDSEVALSPSGNYVYQADQEEVANFTTDNSSNAGDVWGNVNPATTTQTVVDRMWMDTFGDKTAYIGYHQLGVGANVFYNVTTDGGATWTKNIGGLGKFSASQTGPLVVDNTAGPNRGTIYHIYRTSTDTNIAVSKDGANSFVTHTVAGDFGGIFPWLAIDTAGNLYATWITGSGSDVVLSTSLATDPKNVGAPGTVWSTPVRVSTPPVQTAVMAEVSAGSPGRVAILYYGTSGDGTPDSQPMSATWKVYAALSTDALCGWSKSCAQNGLPSFTQSQVSRRVAHTTDICTAGTTCTGNRNLDDMIDIDYDADGRLFATWTDDNNDGHRGLIRVARLQSGPSLLANHPPLADLEPSSPMADPVGDARWYDRTNGANQPGADLTELAVTDDGTKINFRFTLANASKIDSAIANVEGSGSNRLLLVARWESADQEYFTAYEQLPANGGARAFSGRVLATDGLENNQYVGAIGYQQHDAASFVVSGNSITVTQDLAKLGAPPVGTILLSVVAASFIGPTEATEARVHMLYTLDATRAFDYPVAGPKPMADMSILPDAAASPDLAMSMMGADLSTLPADLSAVPQGDLGAPDASAPSDDLAMSGGDDGAVADAGAAGDLGRRPDLGTRPDLAMDAPVNGDASGCGCAVGARRPPATSALALLCLAIGWQLRRRRR